MVRTRRAGALTMSAKYLAAASVNEAAQALRDDPSARIIAGGTDLMVAARTGRAALPESLVSIHNLDDARGLVVDGSGRLRMGALTTHADLLASSEITVGWTALADAAAL